MPAKRYPVLLDKDQRDSLITLTTSGTASARKLTHARILLKADAGEFGPAYPDKAIKAAVDVSLPTIQRVRKTFALEGLEAALLQESHLRSQDRKSLMAKKRHISSPWPVRIRQKGMLAGRCGC